MNEINKTLIAFALCCVAGQALASDWPTPEEIQARFTAMSQEKQALLDMDDYARAAIALDTNAQFGVRLDAIESLANNPTPHLDTLEALLKEPDWTLRFAAIEVIEPVRTDLAYQAAKQLVQEASRSPDASLLDIPDALWAAALLARMGDASAMPFIADQLHHSPSRSLRGTALSALYSYYYLKEAKPYEPIIRFIDQTLPDLNSSDSHTQEAALSLLPSAVYKLSMLHAVEALPSFGRWLSAPMPKEVRSRFESTQRDLEVIKARRENGEPDMRDDPNYKRIPGVTPAWQLPKTKTDM